MHKIVKVQNIRDIKKQVAESYNIEIDVKEIIADIEKTTVRMGVQKLKITQKQFIQIIRQAKKCFFNEPCLLKISSPIRVATGTLGNYKQLSSIFVKFGNPKFINYLFIGDYAGRYPHSIECLVALCAYKITMPYNFFMLRGCHQCIGMAKSYQLYSQICKRFSSKAWLQVCELYCNLPYAAIIDDKIFTVHGGLSPSMKNVEQINKIKKPGDTPDRGIGCDLVWSDHNPNISDWAQNQRGVGFAFGTQVLSEFISLNDFTLVCRGHQVAENGYLFSPSRRQVTICSLPNYLGYYRNDAAIMNIDDQNNLFFSISKQRQDQQSQEKEKQKVFKLGDFIIENC